MCYLVLALLLTFFPVRAFATTYYVDGVNGNNSNSGTSPASAWQTISKVNSVSFSSGDTILFHGGQTWREEIQPTTLNGSVNNPITFGVYSASSPHFSPN
jgi:hypothetical protein